MNNAELTLVFLAIAFVATLAGRFIVRRFGLRLRRIPAYEALPLLAADTVESDLRLHFSFGHSALGADSTISALASAEVTYRIAERVAVAQQTPMITLSDAITLPLAQDTLRRAYAYRQRLDRWNSTLAIWYPQGPRSLTFAAGVASLNADHQVDSSILLGRFGFELALLGENALRTGQDLTAHSDLLEGQAIAYAQADRVLLGEELYVGPAYMDGNALQRGGIVALETLRWLVVLGILVEAINYAL